MLDHYCRVRVPVIPIRIQIGRVLFCGTPLAQAHATMAIMKQRSDQHKRVIALAVQRAFSAAGALKRLGLRVAGGNYKTLYSHIRQYGLDTSHWTGQAHLRGRNHNWAVKTALEEILVADSSYRGGTYKLKRRLVLAGFLREQCALCGIRDWREQPLNLHLDHVNGIATDNQIENLRLLCPNCHSQTETYCGKNKGRRAMLQGSERPFKAV